MFVTSDRDGQYRVILPPGTYWIGAKSKAMNPTNDRPGAKVFAEKEVVVREGVFHRSGSFGGCIRSLSGPPVAATQGKRDSQRASIPDRAHLDAPELPSLADPERDWGLSPF